MKAAKILGVALLLAFAITEPGRAQEANKADAAQVKGRIPKGAKVFVAPMDGFDVALKKALADKKVPVEVVEKREDAAYEITGAAESKKASTAKKLIMGSFHSDEDASIKVADLKSGEIMFAYAVHKKDSAHGQRSTAEACAKHLKDEAVAAK
jgi:hypothetical protein